MIKKQVLAVFIYFAILFGCNNPVRVTKCSEEKGNKIGTDLEVLLKILLDICKPIKFTNDYISYQM